MIDTSINNGECSLINNVYKTPKVAKLLKEAVGSGTCPNSSIIGTKRLDDCTFNQSCTINQDAVSDNCNDTTGIRKIKHTIQLPALGQGESCIDASRNFVLNKYGNKVSYEFDEKNNEINIEMRCEKSENCEIDFDKKLDSYCDGEKKEKYDVYKIISEEKGNGKVCEEISKSKFPNATNSNSKEGFMYVYSPCSITKPSNIIQYVVIVIVIILFLIGIYKIVK